MKKQVITAIIVGIFVPIILAILGTIIGWLPKTSDYRIPSGTIAAFALATPPYGWERYTPAQGRFIVGKGTSGGPSYGLEQTGGIDASRLLPDIFVARTAGLSAGGGNYLAPNSNISGSFDGRPPFVALLICRKK